MSSWAISTGANVIALLAIAITFVPVLLAQLLTRDEGGHVR